MKNNPSQLLFAGTHHHFPTRAWSSFAPGLKSLADALDIRRRLVLSLKRAELETDARRQAQMLTFVTLGKLTLYR